MGKHKKKKYSSESYRVAQKPLECTIEYFSQVAVMGEIKITQKMIESTPGAEFDDKLKQAIKDRVLSMIPSAKYIQDVKFKIPTTSLTIMDEIFRLDEEKKRKESELAVDYYGLRIVKTNQGLKKKLAVFKFPDLEKAWREQRVLWGDWKNFISVFIDDNGVEFDLEQNDKEGLTLDDELELKEKLLKVFPDDSKLLG